MGSMFTACLKIHFWYIKLRYNPSFYYLAVWNTYTHACMDTHTHAHAYKHTHIRTHMHAHTHTYCKSWYRIKQLSVDSRVVFTKWILFIVFYQFYHWVECVWLLKSILAVTIDDTYQSVLTTNSKQWNIEQH